MTARSSKMFRVEKMQHSNGAAQPADTLADRRHRELMAFMREIRQEIAPAEKVTEKVVEDYKLQLEEARKLKTELDSIHEAINRTKHEIATLHHSGFQGEEMGRVTNELDAIVSGTEYATEGILAAAETIDQLAGDLAARLRGKENAAMAGDIQESTIKIFEHCNFQDLTGQRITKVVNVLRFIEERIVRMMEIWGGMEAFAGIQGEEMEKRTGDAALLNGPALDTDTDVASQDDIDALFA